MVTSRRRPARNAVPAKQDYGTPDALFLPLHAAFDFTIDVCATAENAKLPRYFTPEQDGLAQRWWDERVFCNPPFAQAADWISKAHAEAAWNNALAALVLPSATDTALFHDLANRAAELWFLKGRVKFVGGPTQPQGGHLIAVFHPWRRDVTVKLWDWRREPAPWRRLT